MVLSVGEHKLGGMVKDMFTEVGISGKSDHSLRATGASMLFQANVPEKKNTRAYRAQIYKGP